MVGLITIMGFINVCTGVCCLTRERVVCVCIKKAVKIPNNWVYVWVRVCILFMCVWVRECVQVSVCINTRVFRYMYGWTCVCVCMCASMCACVCVSVCVSARIYIYTYVHICAFMLVIASLRSIAQFSPPLPNLPLYTSSNGLVSPVSRVPTPVPSNYHSYLVLRRRSYYSHRLIHGRVLTDIN